MYTKSSSTSIKLTFKLSSCLLKHPIKYNIKLNNTEIIPSKNLYRIFALIAKYK
jgi:hypothetical protein